MAYQEEIDAIVKRFNQSRSDETIRHMRAIQALKAEEEGLIEAIRAKYGKPPGHKTPWQVRCEQFDISFELPSFSEKPQAIPGIDYIITDLSAASTAYCKIVQIAGQRKIVLPKFYSWTITTPKGRTEVWDEDRLHQETAFEIAAG